MNRVCLFFLLLIAVLPSSFAATTANTLKVRVTDFPPNYYQGPDGHWQGLSVELAAAIIERAGYRPVFVEQPWARGLKSMRSGTLHYMTNMQRTAERSEYLNWLGPVRQDEMVLIVHAKDRAMPVDSLEDMVRVCHQRKKRFGYQPGVFYSEEFERRIGQDPEFAACFEAISQGELNFRKVMTHRILGFFESRIAAIYRMQNNPDYRALALHPFVLSRSDVYHGISQAGVAPDVLKRLRQAYLALVNEGTLAEIVDRYQSPAKPGT
ncbi:transporter substrate-binding domain-containing protein [Marinobacteraceae bacterium S3BR75-40.1]